MRPTLSNENAAEQSPLSEKGKKQLLKVLNSDPNRLNIPKKEWQEYIRSHSYFDYLQITLGVDDPGVMRMARNSVVDYGSTPEFMSMEEALESGALGLDYFSWKDALEEVGQDGGYIKDTDKYAVEKPFIHHFPDGNATIARMLVKKMVPTIGPGNNVEEIVLSKFDYSELDKPKNNIRIRLNSTVVNVNHLGDPSSSDSVSINYINDRKSYKVRAKSTVLACYNMMIPHLVSELPENQAMALRLQTKSPFVYTTVGLRNWHALKDSGIGVAMSPGNMHQAVLMDFPVSMGGYKFTESPDQPCVIQMISCPFGSFGAPPQEQFKEARYRMLSMQFDDYEQEIRRHLSGMLPKDLFDFNQDVASISVNRWAHGYTFAGPGDSVSVGRQPFGRITVANSDSAPGADAKTAMMMAHRAINELS